MPDLRTYKLAHICGLFDEAIRTIPGYDKYDPTYEPKALISYEKTKDNYAIYINPCMRHEKGVKSKEAKSAKVKALIKEKTGKEPRKDAVACSLILTLPRDYAGDPKEFFESAVEVLCIIMGIKREDILYACVHMDESQPHLHFAFLPMAYVKDYDAKLDAFNAAKAKAKADGTKVPARPSYLKGETNRKIEADEVPVTMNCGRFGSGFLHFLNKTIESRLSERGIEASIATGRGSQFDPQLLPKKQREESLKLYEENAKLRKELKKLKTDKATLQSEAAKATEEMEAAQAEALAAKSQAAEATLEVAKAKEELADAEASAEETKASLEEYQQDKEQLIKEIKEIKSGFRDFFANIKSILKSIIKNTIKEFLPAWAKATAGEKEDVTQQAKAFVSRSIVKPIEELVKCKLNN